MSRGRSIDVRQGVVAAAAGLALLTLAAPPAAADPGLGGCSHGGMLSGARIPGTGSAGQSVRREADVWGCSSPLLPGIESGHFSAELPFNSLTAPTLGQFAWGDGSVSSVIGQPNGLWTITGGPGGGHTFRFDLAHEMNVWWYHWDDSMPVRSVSFLE
ncbi:hypothetical protein AB0I30_05485 [Nocardia tengchongensis]|uniref:hypothetical protein n=1 Tax=Nocardia tengchongensis TaxID=2055889 RepID=UPI00340B6E85